MSAETIKRASLKLNNKSFYKADGSLDVEKAKQAYFDMFKRFKYPYECLDHKNMMLTDFGLKDFPNVGMAGFFWVNNNEYNYYGSEIYLLPGQMIVEHAHVDAGDVKAKMEAWLVRYGNVWSFSEGEANLPMPIELPKSQEDAKAITSRHWTLVKPGEMAALNRPGAKHFLIAGPQGAIATEFATYHADAGLRFTNPGVTG